jgi:uracil-DNA glycosylase family 4
MSEQLPLTPDRLARQAKQHLESLRTAGIEWLPDQPVPVVNLPVVPEAGPSRHSLFGEELPAAARSSLTREQRQEALATLAQRVAQCTRCPALARARTQTVFGVGSLDPEICFIGEAPGADEDRQGEPFVGPAGQLLNRIIAACGMKREDVYICNILRCRPPGNRTPLPDEAANCREYLDQTLELVRPRYICCLGACAAQNLLGSTLSVGKLRTRFFDYRGIPVMVTYHPAYLLRNEAAKKDVWEDMKRLLARMGKPIPAMKK